MVTQWHFGLQLHTFIERVDMSKYGNGEVNTTGNVTTKHCFNRDARDNEKTYRAFDGWAHGAFSIEPVPVEVKTDWDKSKECMYDKSGEDVTCTKDGQRCKWAL